MSSEKPALFRVRVDGREFSIGFNRIEDAEAAVQEHVSEGRTVEIIDVRTGDIVKKL
jgi:hypothetical protein